MSLTLYSLSGKIKETKIKPKQTNPQRSQTFFSQNLPEE